MPKVHGPEIKMMSFDVNTAVLVVLGGALGALARFLIVYTLNNKPQYFGLGNILANVLGCFLIGSIFSPSLTILNSFPFQLGIIAGLTTLSGIYLDGYHLWQRNPRAVILYAFLVLGSGLLAFSLGRVV